MSDIDALKRQLVERIGAEAAGDIVELVADYAQSAYQQGYNKAWDATHARCDKIDVFIEVYEHSCGGKPSLIVSNGEVGYRLSGRKIGRAFRYAKFRVNAQEAVNAIRDHLIEADR